MRNTKTQAFTLVELIVVITILAILGTIAFISLQGYSADARNSKRTSDLGNIQSAMSLKQVEGIPLLSFIDDSTNDASIAGISLAGDAVVTDKYKAGTPSYTVLNVAAKDFKDPSEKEYRIGGTTLKAGAFQIVASMEVDGTDTALVNGTFVARGSGAVTIDSTDVKVVTVADASANFFKAGDLLTVTGGSNAAVEVERVSRDGVTITVSLDVTGATALALAADETAGLVLGTAANASTGAVVDDGSEFLAY